MMSYDESNLTTQKDYDTPFHRLGYKLILQTILQDLATVNELIFW